MIGAQEFERAEHTLRVVYQEQSLPRQLELVQIDREALDNLLKGNIEILHTHYREAMSKQDPRLTAAYNTLLVHFMLIGVLVGKQAERSNL